MAQASASSSRSAKPTRRKSTPRRGATSAKKATGTKRKRTGGTGGAKRRGARRRESSGGLLPRLGRALVRGAGGLVRWAAPRVRFVHVFVVLLLAVLYVHDVRVEWDGAEGPTGGRGSAGAPSPRLASFDHPPAHSATDVERLRAEYVATYAPLAQAEMEAYGIPASITLAQGLLESVAGTSRLARETNNHFGIKCFSKRCAAGHCRNFGDDHHKDFFRAYEHPRDSYRAHSEFLRNGKRYARLFALDSDDYRGWAHGLSAAGYATDPRYASKLIALVERYGLDEYDDDGGFF